MSHETQTANTQETTRRQKLLRRFLPVVLLAGGVGAAAHEKLSNDEPNHETSPIMQVHVNDSAEFGGSADDWEHGTAEALIEALIDKGLAQAAAKLGEDGLSAEVQKSAEELPTYAQANIALEMAENGTIPDEGDLLTIGIDLNVNSNDTVTYVVTDAAITDKPNNQE